MEDNGRRTVQSVVTACRLIEALHGRDSAGVTELSRDLDISKTTVYHHLSTLRERGYVIKTGDAYQLSLELVSIGEHAKNQFAIYHEGKEEIDRVAAQTGEYANLVAEQNGYCYILHKKPGEYSVPTASQVGQRAPLHSSGAGKAILASFDDEKVRELVDAHGLPAYTSKTITDEDALFAELETIRANGYAAVIEEYVEGASMIAASVEDQVHDVRGAVSISGPTTRLLDSTTGPKHERFREELVETAVQTANLIEMRVNMAAD